MKKKIGLAMLCAMVACCFALPADALTILMDPNTRNGSFEDTDPAVTGQWQKPSLTGWQDRGQIYAFADPGGPHDYLVWPFADGVVAIQLDNTVGTVSGYSSDVIDVPTDAGSELTLSVDFGFSENTGQVTPCGDNSGGAGGGGWDGYAGQIVRLYEVDPADSNNRTLLLTLTSEGGPGGVGGGDAPECESWKTLSGTGYMLTDGWHLQVELHTIGDSWAQMMDNVVLSSVPASIPVLHATPSSHDVGVEASSITFDIANVGPGSIDWTAAVTSGNSWLSLAAGSESGTNDETITVNVAENPQDPNATPRSGTITVTAGDPNTPTPGSPKVLTVNQAQPFTFDSLLMGPGVRNGSFEDVANAGNWGRSNVATGWNPIDSVFRAGYLMQLGYATFPPVDAPTTDGVQFLQPYNNGSQSPPSNAPLYWSDVIEVAVGGRDDIEFRVSFGFGSNGDNGPPGGWRGYRGQEARLLAVNPNDFSDTVVLLTLTSDSGNGTVPAPGTWLQLTDTVVMPDDNHNWYLQVEAETGDLDGNPDLDYKSEDFDLSWDHAIDNVIVGVTDNPDPPLAILSVTPREQVVNNGASSTTFDVTNTGGASGMAWTAAVGTDPDNMLSISGGAAGTDAGTITVDFTENPGVGERSGEIVVTAPGAIASPITVTVRQPVCGEFGIPAGDITGPNGVSDCVVDIWDFAEWAQNQWLDCTIPGCPS